jgi:hypothetical protein
MQRPAGHAGRFIEMLGAPAQQPRRLKIVLADAAGASEPQELDQVSGLGIAVVLVEFEHQQPTMVIVVGAQEPGQLD